MHPTLEQLQKILDLELKSGCTNKAVIGGLPKMLSYWEPNARRANFPAGFVDAAVERIRAYPDVPQDERQTALQNLLSLIKEAETPPVVSAPAPREVPDKPASAKPAPTPIAAPRPTPPLKREPAPTPKPPTPKPPVQPKPAAAKKEDEHPAPKPVEKEPAKEKAGAPHPHPHRPHSEMMYTREEPLDPRPRRPVGPQPLNAPKPIKPDAGLDAPLTVLHGVGPEYARRYEALGLTTLRQVLLYLPRTYHNYATMRTINRLEYGEECTVIGEIHSARTQRIRNGRNTMHKIVLADLTGQIECSFFFARAERTLTPGKQIVVSGRVDQYLGRPVLVPKEWEFLDQHLLNTGRIIPVYPLTEGISQHHLRKMTAQVAQYWARKQPDHLPRGMVERAGLLSYGEALAQIHFPDNLNSLEAAQHRLAFDELLLLQLGVLRQKKDWQASLGQALEAPQLWYEQYRQSLPYQLTGAQQRAVQDIRNDLHRATPMNRLLQGDVGAGKTVVAAVALAITVQANAQGALMVPTSILAEQHHHTISLLLQNVIKNPAVEIRLLQGATPATEKEAIYAGLRSGEVKVVVGTHALIEAPVEFANLGLVVVDEQHRFGVAQRAALRNKGTNPHLLVMTATPIPRSLALTVYGDLDLSVLDELPPGRRPIQTNVIHAKERERGFAFIRSQLHAGRQAFIIFPLVEESEKSEAKAAVAEHKRLQDQVFRDFKLGLLHGRLKPDEKEAVMTRFRQGDYQVLVSTSVVEVGVDVPNASVMLVEGANRFGLAQLHQFRGRVGRGAHDSYCLLVSDAPNPRTDERLLALEQSQDGFFLAEKDLQLRGPGDFLGTRQSGFADLQLAKLSDVKTIEKVRREAQAVFATDPELKAPEHQFIAERLAKFWQIGAGDVS